MISKPHLSLAPSTAPFIGKAAERGLSLSFWSTRHLHVELGRAAYRTHAVLLLQPLHCMQGHPNLSGAHCLDTSWETQPSCSLITVDVFQELLLQSHRAGNPHDNQSPTPLQELGKGYAGIQLTNGKGEGLRFSLAFTPMCFSPVCPCRLPLPSTPAPQHRAHRR